MFLCCHALPCPARSANRSVDRSVSAGQGSSGQDRTGQEGRAGQGRAVTVEHGLAYRIDNKSMSIGYKEDGDGDGGGVGVMVGLAGTPCDTMMMYLMYLTSTQCELEHEGTDLIT